MRAPAQMSGRRRQRSRVISASLLLFHVRLENRTSAKGLFLITNPCRACCRRPRRLVAHIHPQFVCAIGRRVVRRPASVPLTEFVQRIPPEGQPPYVEAKRCRRPPVRATAARHAQACRPSEGEFASCRRRTCSRARNPFIELLGNASHLLLVIPVSRVSR